MKEIEKLQFELEAVNHIIKSGFATKQTYKLKETIETLLIQEQEKFIYGENNG